MYTGIILVFLPRLRNFSNIALFYQCRQNRKLRLSFQVMLWTFFFRPALCRLAAEVDPCPRLGERV